MNPVDIGILLVLGLILGAAAAFLWRGKKKGKRCIGCPDSGKCCGSCQSCPGCKG